MICFEEAQALSQQIDAWKQSGQTVALVPTLGNLHQGHLSLVKKAASLCDKVVVSIYLNPMQFAMDEDIDNYPRTLSADQQALEALSVDCLFMPNTQVMYPASVSESAKAIVPGLSGILCGEFRPDHFDGVTTIVNKLFNITRPNVAIFGEKDFQQVFIIKKMVDDLFIPVNIVSMPTVRETDGLAMSSRNQYLDAAERQQAGALHQTLLLLKDKAQNGDDLRQLERFGSKNLLSFGFNVDYLSFRSEKSLLLAQQTDKDLVLLVAAWMGKTRLIDNIRVG